MPGENIDNLSSGAHVLRITENLIIWRLCPEKKGEKMYQNVEHAWDACRIRSRRRHPAKSQPIWGRGGGGRGK